MSNVPLHREHTIRIVLSEAEQKLIDSYVALFGEDKESLLRKLLLEQARIELDIAANLGAAEHGREAPNSLCNSLPPGR